MHAAPKQKKLRERPARSSQKRAASSSASLHYSSLPVLFFLLAVVTLQGQQRTDTAPSCRHAARGTRLQLARRITSNLNFENGDQRGFMVKMGIS